MYIRTRIFLTGYMVLLAFALGCRKDHKTNSEGKVPRMSADQRDDILSDDRITLEDEENKSGVKIAEISFSSTSTRYLVNQDNEFSSTDIKRIFEGMEQITKEDFARYAIPSGPGYIMHGVGKSEAGNSFTWVLYAGFAGVIDFSDGTRILLAAPPKNSTGP